MVSDKQIQRAGDNSQQMQAGTINVTNVLGIDEKRAREIFNEMYAVVRKDFTKDAYECAEHRVAQFEEKFMPQIVQISGALDKFSDPSFQFLIASAHKTAAATDREADYELLSELLVHRIQKGENRKIQAGISRAVEVVDKVDDDALCALTVSHAVSKLIPTSGLIIQGLDTLESVFEKLMYMELPRGSDWLEHLEILDAVRITPFASLKKIHQYYSERLDGYVCVGIKKSSDDYARAITILEEKGITSKILCNHELMDEYVRLPISEKENIMSLHLVTRHIVNGQLIEQSTEMSEEQKDAVKQVYELYSRDEAKRAEVSEKFIAEWEKRRSLSKLCQWWDSIAVSFNITSVGTVLAHSNAQRCDKGIPPLE